MQLLNNELYVAGVSKLCSKGQIQNNQQREGSYTISSTVIR